MTDYEKLVRHTLIDREMSQTELARQVNKMTGLYCDQSYIARTMSGNGSPKIKAAINAILGIEVNENATG